MGSVNAASICLLFVGLLGQCLVRNSYAIEEDEGISLTDASYNKFAETFFSEALRGAKDRDNVFFSPWSIYSALSLMLAATQGTTHQQILQGMALSPAMRDLHQKLAKWQRAPLVQPEEGTNNTNSSVTLSLANRAFVEKSLELKQTFVDLVGKEYLAGVGQVNFSRNPEDARQEINQWVEQQTQEKIKGFLQKGSVSTLTKAVLVNAVYFKGHWMKPFDKASTKPSYFHCFKSNGTAAGAIQNNAEMMAMNKEDLKFAEVEELKAKMVWLPFSDNRTELVILLPDQKDGLSTVEEQFHANSIRLFQLLKEKTPRWTMPVSLQIPRLNLENALDLKQLLQTAFNMTDLFSESKADLSGMTPASGVFVSSAVHKAVFEMNEEGATAAAATGFGARVLSLPPPPKEFIVDHPFMLFVMSERQTPLFVGRVVCL